VISNLKPNFIRNKSDIIIEEDLKKLMDLKEKNWVVSLKKE
jgi:hypothetical protein